MCAFAFHETKTQLVHVGEIQVDTSSRHAGQVRSTDLSDYLIMSPPLHRLRVLHLVIVVHERVASTPDPDFTAQPTRRLAPPKPLSTSAAAPSKKRSFATQLSDVTGRKPKHQILTSAPGRSSECSQDQLIERQLSSADSSLRRTRCAWRRWRGITSGVRGVGKITPPRTDNHRRKKGPSLASEGPFFLRWLSGPTLSPRIPRWMGTSRRGSCHQTRHRVDRLTARTSTHATTRWGTRRCRAHRGDSTPRSASPPCVAR